MKTEVTKKKSTEIIVKILAYWYWIIGISTIFTENSLCVVKFEHKQLTLVTYKFSLIISSSSQPESDQIYKFSSQWTQESFTISLV